MTEFLKSLAKGDLVLATNWGSEKMHLLRLTRPAVDDYDEGHPKRERVEGFWNGFTLCPLRPRYYYTPRTEPGHDEDRCRLCFQRWRAEGKTAGQREPVKGWTQPMDTKDWGTWPLPFGWRQLPADRHPYDVAPDGDINSVVDKEGNVKGVLRTERHRWQRGYCVVRIVEEHGEKARGYAVLYHDARQRLKESTSRYGALSNCLERAWTLMAQGGRP